MFSRSKLVFIQRLKWKQIVCSFSVLNFNRLLSNTTTMINGSHTNDAIYTNGVESDVNRRILAIQSHVVHGYVGNKSATFPLQVSACNFAQWHHFNSRIFFLSLDFSGLGFRRRCDQFRSFFQPHRIQACERSSPQRRRIAGSIHRAETKWIARFLFASVDGLHWKRFVSIRNRRHRQSNETS